MQLYKVFIDKNQTNRIHSMKRQEDSGLFLSLTITQFHLLKLTFSRDNLKIFKR